VVVTTYSWEPKRDHYVVTVQRGKTKLTGVLSSMSLRCPRPDQAIASLRDTLEAQL
jgi:hypothetical protein